MESKGKTMAIAIVGALAIVAILCVSMVWSVSFVNGALFNSNESLPTSSDVSVVVLGSEEDGEVIESALERYSRDITIQNDFENIPRATIVLITENYALNKDYNYLVDNINYLTNHGCPVFTLFESPYLLIGASNGGHSYMEDSDANGMIQIHDGDNTFGIWYGTAGASEYNTIRQCYTYGVNGIAEYARYLDTSESEIQE